MYYVPAATDTAGGLTSVDRSGIKWKRTNGAVKNQTTPYHKLEPAMASLEFNLQHLAKQTITTRNLKQK
jgi:hypothetical protein